MTADLYPDLPGEEARQEVQVKRRRWRTAAYHRGVQRAWGIFKGAGLVLGPVLYLGSVVLSFYQLLLLGFPRVWWEAISGAIFLLAAGGILYEKQQRINELESGRSGRADLIGFLNEASRRGWELHKAAKGSLPVPNYKESRADIIAWVEEVHERIAQYDEARANYFGDVAEAQALYSGDEVTSGKISGSGLRTYIEKQLERLEHLRRGLADHTE